MSKGAFDYGAWMSKRDWKIGPNEMMEFALSYGSYLSLFLFETCWIVERRRKEKEDPSC
jgi:hypothetical protein